ncbi:hypothetical protein QR680_007323 [Steinernema hermaphroditum]|uniref:Transmembrane protein n=1 Tax=Steinernema hermaphroditum TaxID=289476 RepID=A0AA39ICT9_9BILA|nr:hypothetical protein QR680_007323 [Steinernema hermaphroditum]
MPPSSWHCSKCDSSVVSERQDSAILMHCKCSGVSEAGHSLAFALDALRKPLERTLLSSTTPNTRSLSQIEVAFLLCGGFVMSSYFAYEMILTFAHKLLFFV